MAPINIEFLKPATNQVFTSDGRVTHVAVQIRATHDPMPWMLIAWYLDDHLQAEENLIGQEGPELLRTRDIAIQATPSVSHVIKVRCQDAFNSAESSVMIQNHDSTAPFVEIVEPKEGAQIDKTLHLRGSASDLETGVAIVEWALDGAQSFAATLPDDNWATWHAEIPVLTPGEHKIAVRSRDRAGNQNVQILTFHVARPFKARDIGDLIDERAYLEDLLWFASNHIGTPRGGLSQEQLARTFFQPFDTLIDPLATAARLPVNQVRLAVEVLRSYLSPAAGGENVWVDDSLPAGAVIEGAWNWVQTDPTPYSGTRAHKSDLVAGAHQHYFFNATATLTVDQGDWLFAYVYLDPENMPTQVMLQWYDGSWDHRAYWGIEWGVSEASRRFVGQLPPAGQWVRLQVPARAVDLEGRVVSGMAFTLLDGRATWDRAGKGIGPRPSDDLIQQESNYCEATYAALLNRIGTSYEEIRLARGADSQSRKQLALRLGIELDPAQPDQLDALFLRPKQITESALENLFGLTDTTRAPFMSTATPHLLAWQQSRLNSLWMALDGQFQSGQSPVIDPDVVGENNLRNAVSGNSAFDIWHSRTQWVDKAFTTLKQAREAHATDQQGFDTITKGVLGVALDDLEAAAQQGNDIAVQLKALPLPTMAFARLLRVHVLAKSGTVLDSEWDDVYNILVQVEKEREFATWRAEERKKQIVLAPKEFQLADVLAALRPWRATRQARREWERTLRARIEQAQALLDTLSVAVSDVEELTRPLMRDALVRSIGGIVAIDEPSEWLSARLLVDMRSSGAIKTTRIRQAIETIQAILFSLRTGQFDGSTPIRDWQITEADAVFDQEWAWMGTYEAWRAAQMTFYFPENTLLPSLRERGDPDKKFADSDQSVAFMDLLGDLRKRSHTLTPNVAETFALFYLAKVPESLRANLGQSFKLTSQLTNEQLLERGRLAKQQLEPIKLSDSPPYWKLETATSVYLKEIFYFVPMQLALQLQKSGEYVAALDWYQTVYAYQLPAEQRKIYYGLAIENSNLSSNHAQDPHWLRDALNPHNIAARRSNPYTRFTLMSIARCFVEFADAEFTRDTAESIAHARALYVTARQLLHQSELQTVLDASGDPVLPNPVLEALCARVEIQLAKLRQGRNIAGMQRNLDLTILASDGLPAGSLNGRGAPAARNLKPTSYRYVVLLERSKQLVAIAQQIEAQYLAALEKQDAENYNLLRATQDLDLASAREEIQKLRVTEAQRSIEIANRQQQRSQVQADYYQQLLAHGPNRYEDEGLRLLGEAAKLQIGVAIANEVVATSYMIAGFATGGATALAGLGYASTGLSAHAQALSTQASIASTLGGYERRTEEWQHQKRLADQDMLIGEQQILLAQDHKAIAQQEATIAHTQSLQARAVVDFLAQKFTTAELYEWMSGVLADVYSYFLQQATAIAQLAQSQLAFERQVPLPNFIQADYWQTPTDQSAPANNTKAPDRRGLTGSGRLLQDIYQLDQYAFESDKRKLNLSQTFSLAQLAPYQFQQFRDTGVLPFTTPMSLFDRAFPGHYLRLIKRVRTSVIALIPPTHGIRATLMTSGISRVIIGGDSFQEVIVRRDPELVALTSPVNATGLFELDVQSDMLLPFESMGVDTAWEFQMPKAANIFDYKTIADVLVTIDYTALHDFNYRNFVIQQLDRNVSADRAFSFRRELPDQWYDLHNPDDSTAPLIISFETTRADFLPNLLNYPVLDQLLMYFQRSDGSKEQFTWNDAELATRLSFTYRDQQGNQILAEGTAQPLAGVISTRRGNASDWRQIADAKHAAIGRWSIELSAAAHAYFRNTVIEDILFVVTYSGQTPEWPA